MRRSIVIICLAALAVTVALRCLPASADSLHQDNATDGADGAVAIQHIVWVWFENREASAINGTSAPYFTSFASANVNLTNFYGVTHPSQPNYLDAFSGSNQGVINDGHYTFPATVDSLAKQMMTAGKSWRVYAQDFPGNCFDGDTYTGGIDGPGLAGQYVRKHNPVISF